MEFIRKCKQYGAVITCGSDAHISFDVGKFDKVKAMDKVEVVSEIGKGTKVILYKTFKSL